MTEERRKHPVNTEKSRKRKQVHPTDHEKSEGRKSSRPVSSGNGEHRKPTRPTDADKNRAGKKRPTPHTSLADGYGKEPIRQTKRQRKRRKKIWCPI